MIALGAKCGIGDQLHPSGKIDPHGYDLIDKVYAEVAEKFDVIEEEVKIGSSLGSGNNTALHFGLGAATGQQVMIRWPDGTVRYFTGIKSNQIWTVHYSTGQTSPASWVQYRVGGLILIVLLLIWLFSGDSSTGEEVRLPMVYKP